MRNQNSKDFPTERIVRIGLFTGETSSGKSSLINLILGEEILPYSHKCTTATIWELKFGKGRSLVVHFKDKDPETKLLVQPTGSSDKSYLEQISSFVDEKTGKGSDVKKVELFWPHSLLEVHRPHLVAKVYR